MTLQKVVLIRLNVKRKIIIPSKICLKIKKITKPITAELVGFIVFRQIL
jgi:hypothetical protein